MMSFRSIIAFLFAFAAFTMFANATPVVAENGLVARSPAPAALAGRALTHDWVKRCDHCCTTQGCNEQAIAQILANLNASIQVGVQLLDGIANPGPIIIQIKADIQAALNALADVEVNVSAAGALLVDIANIIISIILQLALAISKYGLVVITSISLQIDASLAALVNICVKLVPTLQALLSAGLKADLDLLVAVKFVLTLIACGL